ncbi:bifunctional diaminohydroxyphosphoribosylaminopyrimidine deaminase/5-amino-6-(5-phosphoribosylamino)uracil reductase RibD [Sphingomonas swuensis]|uniref:Riboflavin biosynthesis protein RibD n=1 Tax=Sphingomonas swuensis TaxID=977800 RepID=A0ABP7S934_9SPHN
MAAAVALGAAARGTTAPNPNVGCLVIAPDGAILGRGATRPGGRPHAEAVALAEAGERAQGASLVTTLEPCNHRSHRGPTCTDLILQSGVAHVVAAIEDPDRRTSGEGLHRLRGAGISVESGIGAAEARESMAGWLTRMALGRPRVTLKLALSIDGKIALPSGESKWITGEDARAHVHLERAHTDMILVGRGTLLADRPRLDVRLPGLEERSPRRALLSRGEPVEGWEMLASPEDVFRLHDVNDLLVEGGSATATAFLAADLVDRILLYRAPIIIGEGRQSVGYIGLDAIGDAHGRWEPRDGRRLGIDRLEVYERVRQPGPASLDFARD